MRSLRSPISQIQTKYWAYRHSGTGITVSDHSEREIPVISSNQYSVLQVIFSEKGITDEWIAIEGSDTVNKYVKLFGFPNTVKYGKMATYAYQALLSGFRLNVLNVAPKDATYANFYLGLHIAKGKKRKQALLPVFDEFGRPVMEEKDPHLTPGVLTQKYEMQDTSEKTDEDFERTLYIKIVEQDKDHENKKTIYMDWDKEKLPAGAGNEPVQEVKLKVLEFEFSPFFVEDLNRGSEYELYMSGENTDGKPKAHYVKLAEEDDSTLDHEALHIPLIGLAYRGRGHYGNSFRLRFNVMKERLENEYPYFNCKIMDKNETEHEFNFTLFDLSQGNLSYSFRDQAAEYCNIQFTPSNRTETFRAYSIRRGLANTITGSIQHIVNQLEKYIKAEITKVVHDFPTLLENPEVIKPQWDTMKEAMNSIVESFTRPNTEAGMVKETPLSRVNPFDNNWGRTYMKTLPVIFTSCPQECEFAGGKLGKIKTLLRDNDFSWDLALSEEEFDLGPDGKPQMNEHGQIKKKIVKHRIFEELFIDAYSGKIDPAIFDDGIVKDSILFGDGYPVKLQETIDNLCRNVSETRINHETGRVDFCYIRTPDYTKRTIREITQWQKSFLNQTKNMNMHPSVGRWNFADISTGGQETFESWYDYLGPDGALYSYLESQTPDSFSSGTWSIIRKGIINSQKLVPNTHLEREDLALADVMYYVRKSDGSYGLGEDTAYNLNKNSVMKTVGSNIHFNRILNIASGILKDNTILEPTKDNLDTLRRIIEEAIKVPAKHFRNQVAVTVGISKHPQEVGRNIVRCEIRVTGHDYSRANMLHMISERPNYEE